MLERIWDQFLQLVKEDAGSKVVETWLKAVSLHQWDANAKTIYIQAPNSFVKEWISTHFTSLFQIHLSRLFNVSTIKIVFLAGSSSLLPKNFKIGSLAVKDPDSLAVKIMPPQTLLQKPTRSSHINRNYLFDSFVQGPNNEMAFAAAYAVTQKLGKLYNPLFIYGGSGLGKTHLLHAIANEIHKHNPAIEVLYQPAYRFVNEFINAIRFDKIHKFQSKYKAIDVFLVDDIQSISNKEQTQEAFFHIFNTMHDAHKQIVFSSDSYPADIDGLAERLRSRLEWGLVADIQAPTLETKIAILKRKADSNNQDLPDDVALFIASLVVSNIRELEGALIRIAAFASLTKQPVTLELAKKVLLRKHQQNQTSTLVNFAMVIKSLQTCFSYTLSDLRSKNRSKQLSLVRQVAMYCMKKFTDKSLQEIAKYLGRKDHTTVLHAYRQIEQRCKEDEKLANQMKRIEATLFMGVDNE